MTIKDRTYLQRLKEHANRNLPYLLDKLGIHFSRRGDLIQACCPCQCHPGDGNNPTAFSWRIQYKHWVCWTHHCQDEVGNDIFGLVRGVHECSFQEAVSIVSKMLREHEVDVNENVETSPSYDSSKPRAHEPVDEQYLQFLSAYHPYMDERALDKAVLHKYEVGHWDRLGTFMHDRLIFPVRDDEGMLVGFTGRTVVPESDWPRKKIDSKWVHGRRFDRWPKPGDLYTGSILYNLHRAKDQLNGLRRIIIVEGPLDGMRLEEAGIHNWVAALGGNFTPAHRALLVKYGVTGLILATDPDKAGMKSREKIRRMVGDLFTVEDANLTQDPGDTSVDDLRKEFHGT